MIVQHSQDGIVVLFLQHYFCPHGALQKEVVYAVVVCLVLQITFKSVIYRSTIGSEPTL